jgi:hypothetical protein
VKCHNCFEDEDTIQNVIEKSANVDVSYHDEPPGKFVVHCTCACGFTHSASVYRNDPNYDWCQQWMLERSIGNPQQREALKWSTGGSTL